MASAAMSGPFWGNSLGLVFPHLLSEQLEEPSKSHPLNPARTELLPGRLPLRYPQGQLLLFDEMTGSETTKGSTCSMLSRRIPAT